jgi:DHA1 family bicyclomycin/chloramphenicol resistance-like MFS transporter
VFIVLGIIILLLLIFVLKETIKEKTSISFSILINNYKSIITKKLFMKYALILMFTTGTYFIFLTNAVFMFKNLNSSLSLIYFYYALVGTSSVAGNLFAKVLLRLLSSIDKVMLVAVIINIFVGVTMLFFIIIGKTNTIELIVLSSITSFTNGILVPLAYTASAVLFPKLLGSASGVAGLLQIAGASLGGAVISYFYLQNIQVLLVLVPIITLLLMLLMLSILKEKRTQSLTVR